jgi:hypothetical protein
MIFTPATARCGFSQSGFRNSEVNKETLSPSYDQIKRWSPGVYRGLQFFRKISIFIMQARPRFSTASTPLGAFQAIVKNSGK